MARKSFARKTMRNKSTRRQKRMTRQRGGDMADVERYILSLDLGPDATPKEKITYIGAIVRTIRPQDVPILDLLPEERTAARTDFNDALETIYQKHGVTNDDIEDEQRQIENNDLLNDEVADRLNLIADKVYLEKVKN